MPRKSKSGKDSDKPAWMMAAEARLDAAAEADKSKKEKSTKTKADSKFSSRLTSSIKTTNDLNTENIPTNKPGWMLAAEMRLKEEEIEKELRRKQKASFKDRSFNDDDGGGDVIIRPIENNELRPQKEFEDKTARTASVESCFNLPKEEEDRLDQLHELELQKLHEKIKLKQSEFDIELTSDSNETAAVSIIEDDTEMNQILKESEIRQKKFLQLIEETKQRMRESCELASVKREEYINIRSTVPKVFEFTTALSDEGEDTGEDNEEEDGLGEDYWGLDIMQNNSIKKDKKSQLHKQHSSSSSSTSEGSNRLPFEEMKANFFNNLDRLAKEVLSAKEDHLKTLGDIHQYNINKLKQDM